MKTLIFKVNLIFDKKISRKIEMPENASLYQLAKAIIVKAYGFYFDHCFGFYSELGDYGHHNSEKKYELFFDLIEEGQDLEPTDAGSIKKTKIKNVWLKPKDKMQLLFDYGDGWRFIVELCDYGTKNPRIKYPRIFDICGQAPEQYPDYEDDEEPRDFENLSEKDLIKILEEGKFYEDELENLAKAMEKKGLKGQILKVGDSQDEASKQVIEYIEYHKKISESSSTDEIKKAKKILLNNKSSLGKKKKSILILAHTGRVDCLRVLEKYAKKPDSELSVWAETAVGECKLFLKSQLLDKSMVEIGKINNK